MEEVFGRMTRGKNCRIYPGAVVLFNAELGDNVTIFPGAIIGQWLPSPGEDESIPRYAPAVKIGSGCIIGSNAVLYNVELGSNVRVEPGAVIGHPPLRSAALQRETSTETLLPVKIGEGVNVGANAVIYHDVEIGKNSLICDTACVREGVKIGERVVVAMGVTINYNTSLGNRVRIMDNAHITGNAVIEDDVFIGMLVTMANDNAMVRRRGVTDWHERGPTIKRFARIGQGTCIHPGVTIGENAIVGANSVVTRDVEPTILVMGAPATFRRPLRPEEIQRVD